MNFFRSVKALQFSKHLTRPIRTFNPPKSEILIANNAGLIAALACINEHGMQNHPKLKIICPPFWLDNIDQYYLNESWGQPINGFPKIARELFYDMYPTYPDTDYIKWGQMQELRKRVLSELENTHHVQIFYGTPSIKKLENNTFDITIGEERFNVPDDTHFYLWYKTPKKHNIPNLSERLSTELYQLPPSKFPSELDFIILGSGLSVYWLAKHFTNPLNTRKIICLKRESDQLRTKIPSNFSVDLSRITVVDLEKSVISVAKDDPHRVIVKNKVTGDEVKGFFCSAIGLEPPYEIVKEVPESQLTSPINWTASEWVSQKNNEAGSLIESYLKMLETTNNLDWGSEPHSYHEAYNPFKVLIQNCISSGIDIDANYLVGLKNALKAEDNSLSSKLIMPLYIKIYNEMYDPTPEHMRLFYNEADLFLKKHLRSDSNDKIETPQTEFSI